MNDALQEARADLAAALRLAARFGLNEGICNHFSYAVADDGGRFLLNPYGLHWSMVRASDLLLVDAESRVVDGAQDGLEATAFAIHGAIHRRRPRARCVLHTHMPYATALACLADGRLQPLHQNALRFQGRVAYDSEFNGLAENAAEGERIAAALGGADVLFLANHGVVVTGESIARAFDDLYYLERACQVQVLAMSTGRPLKLVGDNVAAATFAEWPDKGGSYAAAHFEALKRLLDREAPDYVR